MQYLMQYSQEYDSTLALTWKGWTYIANFPFIKPRSTLNHIFKILQYRILIKMLVLDFLIQWICEL